MTVRTDIPVGLAIAAIGAAIVLASRDLHPIVGAHFGPALFPTILGIVMIAGGLLVAVQARAATEPAEPADSAAGTGEATGQPRYAALIWIVAGTAASMWLFEPIGFIPYCTFLLGGMMLLLGVRLLPALALALPLSVGVYLAFVHLLLVPLPAGLLSFLG